MVRRRSLDGGIALDTRVRRRHVLAVAVAALVLPIVAGCAATTQPSPSAPAPSVSLSAAFGGSVTYKSDGAPATTKVDLVANGASVSGTAVTESGSGTHTVQLECASRNGDAWAVAGTVKETTVPGETAGPWSAVIVKDGPPQRIAIWLSDDKAEGIDCDGWLAAMDPSALDPSGFNPVESGTLVPPPAP